ncbi:FkbM family methyltransferase [Roseomonas indoligenes]|uniref:FkbM family methyltransferase n=1 Tax=Roseomonas indoligenes TaxID=2820811 RepID=A0A940MWZ8_9PROT|nr:FkbM family methyltransferase [Pararoseomonas indoligenes]MBP0494944.1 FkbM family methyltransferase [Pararoseomonas indoligenes]
MSSQPDREAQPWAIPYDGRASLDDIFHCFRLLLGRHPNAEEWAGHSSRVGEPLEAVVGSYVNSLEFARRRLTEADASADYAIAEGDGFRLFASPSDAAVGKHVLAGGYEPEVAAVFRSVLRPGMGVLDIGGNIGYFTMLSAALVGPTGRVFAVEPNPGNARMIEASRVLNGFAQVTVLQAAAGRAPGLLALNTSHSNGTTSTLEARSAAILEARTVACLPLDRVVPEAGSIDLIKVDVEGAEYTALLGCEGIIRRHRPVIVSEFSPGMMAGISGVSGEVYLRWLLDLGYDLFVIEPDASLTPAQGDPEVVMAIHRARMVDHVDLVARPRSGGGLWDRLSGRARRQATGTAA